MRSSSSSKHVSSSSATPSSSYSLLQPLVPEVKEMSSGYTRLSANPMVGEREPPHTQAARCLPASSPKLPSPCPATNTRREGLIVGMSTGSLCSQHLFSAQAAGLRCCLQRHLLGAASALFLGLLVCCLVKNDAGSTDGEGEVFLHLNYFL